MDTVSGLASRQLLAVYLDKPSGYELGKQGTVPGEKGPCCIPRTLLDELLPARGKLSGYVCVGWRFEIKG